MTTPKLREAQTDPWNLQRQWTMALSANEWVIVPEDGGDGPKVLPARLALQLLREHIGTDRLRELVEKADV